MESSERGAESPGYATGTTALPPTSTLVTLARARLVREVATLPPYGSPLLWARLRHGDASLGVLVHLLRAAVRLGDTAGARDLFVLVLDRTQGLLRAWAVQTCATVFAHADSAAESLREDLLQEVTLHLWEQLALRDGEAWELFFQRSLDYAQRHIATAVMQQRGYW